MFNFERLDVWKKAVTFARLIYQVTRQFPSEERFGLTNQIRRAASSVCSNIAEGAARTPADFAKHIGYASGSLYEVVTQAAISRGEGFLSEIDHQRIYTDAEEIARMLSGLRKSLKE